MGRLPKMGSKPLASFVSMPTSRPLLVLLVVALVALGGFVMWRTPAGSSPPAAPSASVGGVVQGHVYTGFAEEPSDVNPLTANTGVPRRLVFPFTHDALLDREPRSGALRPALASEFQVAADGMSCTFTLRSGVCFADGSPLTMADVLFGWELHEARHLPMGVLLEAFHRVAAVDVIDERRFRVEFKDRHFAACQTVGCGWIVVNKAFFMQRVAAAQPAGQAVPAVTSRQFADCVDQIDLECGPGTGPYALYNEPGGVSNWQVRNQLLLVRNEHCWRREAYPGTWNFAGLRTVFRQGEGAGINALLLGELDWFSSGNIDDLLASHASVAANYRKLVFDYDTLGLFRVLWNCQRAPFDDPRVRGALGMLFDRDAIVALCGGAARPARAHGKPDLPETPTDIEPLAFDPAAARRQLREAGFDPAQGRALRLVLVASQGTPVLRGICERFADACKDAGIDLDLRQRDLAGCLAARQTGEWDGMLVMQPFRATGDPFDFLHSTGTENWGEWRHAEVDALLAAARIDPDPAARVRAWQQVHRIVHQQQPAALLVHPLVSMLLSGHVKDVEAGRTGLAVDRAFVPLRYQRK